MASAPRAERPRPFATASSASACADSRPLDLTAADRAAVRLPPAPPRLPHRPRDDARANRPNKHPTGPDKASHVQAQAGRSPTRVPVFGAVTSSRRRPVVKLACAKGAQVFDDEAECRMSRPWPERTLMSRRSLTVCRGVIEYPPAVAHRVPGDH